MSRFTIRWNKDAQKWLVLDDAERQFTAASASAGFDTLLEAETYVIERSERSER